jgi:hypothetical protein
MADVGHMNFFKVNQCGLYKSNDSKSHGCELEETFDLIKDWVTDRRMSATIPWDAPSKTKPKCYCREVHKDPKTGDFLVVLWKSETDSAGAIWGAEEDTANGSGEVYEYSNEVKGKKIIWGRPCYYWVIPSMNSVVSIKFDHSLCDSQMFQDYISECIKNRVDHPNRTKEHTEHGFVRLSSGTPDNTQMYSFKFDVSLRSLNTTNDVLGKMLHKITHLIWRETIEVDVQNQRAEWMDKVNKHLPFVSAKPKSKKRNIEIRAEAKPTLQEVRDIIDKYARENRKPSEWENVGFLVDNTITWVDKYRLKDQIAITEVKSRILPARFLLDQINMHRHTFLNPINASIINDQNLEQPNTVDSEKMYGLKDVKG